MRTKKNPTCSDVNRTDTNTKVANSTESLLKMINLLGNEVDRCVGCYYVCKQIQNGLSRDPMIHSAVNANSWAWSNILFSLQCTFFIHFGRVFDGSSTHSIDKVVRDAVDNATVSGDHSLRGMLNLQRWLDTYTKRAEPYRNIRSKIVAHPVYTRSDQIKEMFSKTEVGEVEKILLFLQRCVSSLRMYALNGHDVNLGEQRLPLKKCVILDTQHVLKQIKSAMHNHPRQRKSR